MYLVCSVVNQSTPRVMILLVLLMFLASVTKVTGLATQCSAIKDEYRCTNDVCSWKEMIVNSSGFEGCSWCDVEGTSRCQTCRDGSLVTDRSPKTSELASAEGVSHCSHCAPLFGQNCRNPCPVNGPVQGDFLQFMTNFIVSVKLSDFNRCQVSVFPYFLDVFVRFSANGNVYQKDNRCHLPNNCQSLCSSIIIADAPNKYTFYWQLQPEQQPIQPRWTDDMNSFHLLFSLPCCSSPDQNGRKQTTIPVPVNIKFGEESMASVDVEPLLSFHSSLLSCNAKSEPVSVTLTYPKTARKYLGIIDTKKSQFSCNAEAAEHGNNQNVPYLSPITCTLLPSCLEASRAVGNVKCVDQEMEKYITIRAVSSDTSCQQSLQEDWRELSEGVAMKAAHGSFTWSGEIPSSLYRESSDRRCSVTFSATVHYPGAASQPLSVRGINSFQVVYNCQHPHNDVKCDSDGSYGCDPASLQCKCKRQPACVVATKHTGDKCQNEPWCVSVGFTVGMTIAGVVLGILGLCCCRCCCCKGGSYTM